MYGNYDEPEFIEPAPNIRPDFQYGPDEDRFNGEDDFDGFAPGETLA